MKKILSFNIFLFICCFLFAQNMQLKNEDFIKERFPTLKKYQYFCKDDCKIFYSDKFITKIIDDNENVSSSLDEKILFKFNNLNDSYIKNLLGPRIFYNNRYIGSLVFVKLMIITDSGYIYIYGNYKDYSFDVIEKYIIKNNKIEKIEQPINYINCKQKTNCDFYIKSQPNINSENVALISKDSEIEVIGIKEIINNNEKEDWVLIKSVLGLTGWVKVFMTGTYKAGYTEGFLPIFSTNELGY